MACRTISCYPIFEEKDIGGMVGMQEQHVILAHGSRLLRGMLKRVIEKAEQLKIVEEIVDISKLGHALDNNIPQWVIISLPPGGKLPEFVDNLIATHPSVRFLAISTDGHDIRMKWLKPQERLLSGLNLNELIGIMQRDYSNA